MYQGDRLGENRDIEGGAAAGEHLAIAMGLYAIAFDLYMHPLGIEVIEVGPVRYMGPPDEGDGGLEDLSKA